ncbi:MAG: hypothetical protein KGR26_04000, partial [Cyanobacteria bacterium REEB65]|nr:hypothetical protein [Cyanobacteria bacterium REEB65]
ITMGMSVSSAGASSAYAMGALQQRRQSFQALEQSLQNGDLAGAQKAFSALDPNGSNNGKLSQLAQALQSGNLSAAQQAFAAMRSGHHHGHHHGGAGQLQGASSASQTSPPGVGTAVNLFA